MLRQILTIVWLATAAAPVLAEPSPVALPGGAVLAIEGPGIAVQLTAVTDARCPSTVSCVWEGTIRLVLTINPGGTNAEQVVLCNACDDGARSAVAAGQRFTLQRLVPPVGVIEALGRAAVVTDYTALVLIEPAG